MAQASASMSMDVPSPRTPTSSIYGGDAIETTRAGKQVFVD